MTTPSLSTQITQSLPNTEFNSSDSTGTSLYFATLLGDEDLVLEALGNGASVLGTKWHGNEAPQFHDSALRRAAEQDSVTILRILLEIASKELNGEALVEALTYPDSRPTSTVTMATMMRSHESTRLLLENGARVEDDASPFGSPLYVGSVLGGVSELLSRNNGYGCNLEYRQGSDATPNEGETPLMAAARNNHIEVVKQLLECGADANAIGSRGETALYLAAQYGHAAVVEVLLKHDAAVDILLSTGERILCEVCKRGHTDVCGALLRTGHIDFLQADIVNGMTPIQYATSHSHEGCIKLLHQFGAVKVDGELVQLKLKASTTFRLPSAKHVEKKSALIIANSSREENGKMLASSLDRIGFDTQCVFNADRSRIVCALESFVSMQQKANALQMMDLDDKPTSVINLIYFCGFGALDEQCILYECDSKEESNPRKLNLTDCLAICASALQSDKMTNIFVLDCESRDAQLRDALKLNSNNSLLLSSVQESQTPQPPTESPSSPLPQRLTSFTRSLCNQLSSRNESLLQIVESLHHETGSVSVCHNTNLLENTVLHRKRLDSVDLMPESPVPVSEIYAMQQSPRRVKKPSGRIRSLSLRRAFVAAALEDERRSSGENHHRSPRRRRERRRRSRWEQGTRLALRSIVGIGLAYATYRIVGWYRKKK